MFFRNVSLAQNESCLYWEKNMSLSATCSTTYLPKYGGGRQANTLNRLKFGTTNGILSLI